MSVYLDSGSYTLLVATCAADLPACRWTGGPNLDAAKLRLGEQHDIWPEVIREDCPRPCGCDQSGHKLTTLC